LENYKDGRVADTLEMFTRLPVKICAEVKLRIHHNLLGRCNHAEVSEVYSRPQALSQCRDWLSKNLSQARLIEVTSTATAAQLAHDKPGAAAIGSRQAGTEYDLNILAADIEDNRNNVTRFAVIGHDKSPRTGHDKTTIMFEIPHRPGSLADALIAFKRNRINMTWIESFPMRGQQEGYLFFVDMEGFETDARVKKTLSALQRRAVRLEIVGSYPKSEPID
jgi:chorismate mutase/prephenate dehydratase